MDKYKTIREELEKMQAKNSKSPCRIKYRGEFLTTSTGKTVWSDARGAKLALRLHFSYVARAYACETFYPNSQYTYAEIDQREEDFFKTLYSEVEFVNI